MAMFVGNRKFLRNDDGKLSVSAMTMDTFVESQSHHCPRQCKIGSHWTNVLWDENASLLSRAALLRLALVLPPPVLTSCRLLLSCKVALDEARMTRTNVRPCNQKRRRIIQLSLDSRRCQQPLSSNWMKMISRNHWLLEPGNQTFGEQVWDAVQIRKVKHMNIITSCYKS